MSLKKNAFKNALASPNDAINFQQQPLSVLEFLNFSIMQKFFRAELTSISYIKNVIVIPVTI